jgi:hypothetical protein
MTPDREKEILARIEELQNWVTAIVWIGGVVLAALILRVFFGVGS